LEAVSDLADFVRCYEPVFLYMMAKKNTVGRQSDIQALRNSLEASRKRVKAIANLFEANLEGKISDERFVKMTGDYEAEQKELLRVIAESEEKLREAEQEKTDLRLLLKSLREFSELRQLTPAIVNTLIRRIEVHNNDKSSGHCYVKVDVHFTAVGMIDVPTENQILAMMDEMKSAQNIKNPA
jgi:ribosome-binding ATPase YchF (GTP1/OBG family)